MQALGVLIDGGSCLGAAVAFHMVELKRIDAEFAGDAFERDAVVDLFSCVIAHISIVVLLANIRLGRRCWPFGCRHWKPPAHAVSYLPIRATSSLQTLDARQVSVTFDKLTILSGATKVKLERNPRVTLSDSLN
jgi:hypothetical protein